MFTVEHIVDITLIEGFALDEVVSYQFGFLNSNYFQQGKSL